ncbi:hypothetical protein JI75_04155 [Berryella intestinalis]|uniref:Uncharacterized protein n=1 Tax=Berryella intestinalis TaxID=1531429 RepID=A0A0A8BA19_9ACTN|nr:hypothetical protein [Berryella intestinalis]AJC11982.1 hypothetical protein JI75_04155 [Berryella intestinalis]
MAEKKNEDNEDRTSDVEERDGRDQGAPEPPKGYDANGWSDPSKDFDRDPRASLESLLMNGLSFNATDEDRVRIKRGRTLLTIANVAGPISLFIGGVLLSSVGTVCGIVSFVNFKRVGDGHPEKPLVGKLLKRQAAVGIGISGIALVINLVAAIMIFPMIMDAVESGDLSAVFNSQDQALNLPADRGTGTGTDGNSTWG